MVKSCVYSEGLEWLDPGCSHWFDDAMIEAQVLKKGLKNGLTAKKDINRSKLYMQGCIYYALLFN